MFLSYMFADFSNERDFFFLEVSLLLSIHLLHNVCYPIYRYKNILLH